MNTVPVSIAGTVAHGQVLTATPGTWTGTPSLSYQWYAGASPISGETGTTYTVDRADGTIGPSVTCRESEAVSGSSADSNALAYDADTQLPDTAIAVTTAGLTTADSGTTGDILAASYGGKKAALTISAPASTNRPAYSASGGPGGRPLLTFDGSDDVLRTTALTMGGAWASFQIDVVARAVGANAAGDMFVRYAPASNAIACGIASDLPRLATSGTGGATSVGSTNLTGTYRQITFEGVSGASGSQVVRVNNGAAEVTTAITHAAWADGAAFSVGADAVGGTAVAMEFLAVAVTRGATAADALTADQRADLHEFLKFHCGF